MLRWLIAPLILSLTLSSVAFGAARGHAPATDRIELCKGAIITHIWRDAEGNEVSGHILCADAAMALLVPPPGGPTGAEFAPAVYRALRPIPPATLKRQPVRGVQWARAPPSVV
ncbi:MAG: hypothetical protein ACU0CI_14575 [Shimia sp.]